MKTSIIKCDRIESGNNFWIGVIKALQDKKFVVRRDFKTKADLNIVLSGVFENPRGFKGKRVMVLEKKEWWPSKFNAWDSMYRDIVKNYYDEIIDVTGKTTAQVANIVADYINAQERQADKS